MSPDAVRDGNEPQRQMENALLTSHSPSRRPLSTFERVITTNGPILESLLLQIPTDTIIKLYHTSQHLRAFLRVYPTAWKALSFRMQDPDTQRQSRPYALDQLLMNVVIPFSSCLKILELDNTAVSGQILISTVLHARRETLVHLSVRGCKNVSLKYHIIPYLTMFGLQYDVDLEKNAGNSAKPKLALKSLYAYRCRHHRRRPYLSASLLRKDSDSEPTHELVNLCHKLDIWTDTAWCTTPAGRCFRRRGYVSMRVPQGSPEVWVVFDRLWRCKNWIGPVDSSVDRPPARDGKLWENGDTGCYGEPLGTGEGPGPGEGKMTPAHLRHSHTQFIQDVKCDACQESILERCEQCSILMHCVGCRRTLCASCAYERPYLHRGNSATFAGQTHGTSNSTSTFPSHLWWAPGAMHSPSSMQDPVGNPMDNNPLFQATAPPTTHPALKFHWCCTEPIFSGGGGISIGTPSRDVDQVRAVPLPRGQGWEDLEYTVSEWSKTFPKYAYGDPSRPDYSLETGHLAMMKWLLGPPTRQVSPCPRNLCQDCYDSPQWKVHCKSCSKPLCIEHDLRGLRLRICGYRDLALEKMTIQNRSAAHPPSSPDAVFDQLPGYDLPFRTQRLIDSTNSSFIEDPPGDIIHEDNPSDAPHGDLSLFPRNPTRSISAPPSNHSGSSSPTSSVFESPLEAPRWQGCQSFFCPPFRSIGDQRQRCPSHLRECKACAVNVCQDCVQANPPCKCSYCEENYLCPNCMKVRAREGTCRRRQEEKARRERKWKKDMQVLEGILELKVANELAESAGQFLSMAERDFRPESPNDFEPPSVPVEDEEILPAMSMTHPIVSMAASGPGLMNNVSDSFAETIAEANYMDSFDSD
ncbi:hypothetical protein N7468_006777 [Penicillium chermesinum]|uniref:Uncharacterized protein n=1 Tax=Penicillium chermesinum TaxID=63820 RepID=A0A9W9NSV6_9EURO|nr:uncharacterized protein N7468_006777 [Penicillium chermesinum]KAJ5225552.1 hypothetical protein N7468_006777 [Penicillium chermesinum]